MQPKRATGDIQGNICEVHPRISRRTPPLIPSFLLLRRGQIRLDLCKLSAFVPQIGFECELLTKPRSVGLALALAPGFSRAGKVSDRI